MSYHIEHLNLHGTGPHPHRVYDMPLQPEARDYWDHVTNVSCPRDKCDGTIRWHEAGYVPGYRICDGCGRCFFARGTETNPTLVLD